MAEGSRFMIRTREISQVPAKVSGIQGLTAKVSEKICEKSDAVVVAMKLMKVSGAKDQTYQAFPDLKHIYHIEDKQVWQVRFRI